MKAKNDENIDALVAKLIAQSIELDIYEAFFGPIPRELALKCQKLTLDKLDTLDKTIKIEDLQAWSKEVSKGCSELAVEFRQKYLDALDFTPMVSIEDDFPGSSNLN